MLALLHCNLLSSSQQHNYAGIKWALTENTLLSGVRILMWCKSPAQSVLLMSMRIASSFTGIWCGSKHTQRKKELLDWLVSCHWQSCVASELHCFIWYFPCGDTFRIAKAQKWKLYLKYHGRGMSQKPVLLSESPLVVLLLNWTLLQEVLGSKQSLPNPWHGALIIPVTAHLSVCETIRNRTNVRTFFLTHIIFQG